MYGKALLTNGLLDGGSNTKSVNELRLAVESELNSSSNDNTASTAPKDSKEGKKSSKKGKKSTAVSQAHLANFPHVYGLMQRSKVSDTVFDRFIEVNLVLPLHIV